MIASRFKKDDSGKEILNVLVAEDDIFQAVAIINLLQCCEFQVIACKNGTSARDELLKAENEFDLILLDMFMPEMTGLQLLQIIRTIERLNDTPVIMMSAEGEKDVVTACLAAGALDYLVKPLNIQKIQGLKSQIKAKSKARKNQNEKAVYQIIKNLGKGACGSIELVQKSTDEQLYTMKVIPTYLMNKQEKKNAESEVSLLKVLKSPTIIKYYESFTENDSLNIIMEYADGGSLESKIQQYLNEGNKIPVEKIWKWLAQLVIAIHFMHQKNILHRDIKTKNIFLTKDEDIKLGDFGISKSLGTHGNFAETFIGSPFFMPPEVIRGDQYSQKSDIWAFGCVVYELVMLKTPFQHEVLGVVFDMIQNKTQEMDPNVDKDIQMIIKKALEKDPNNRPFIQDFASIPNIEKEIIQFYKDHPNETNYMGSKVEQNGYQIMNEGLTFSQEDQAICTIAEMIEKLPLLQVKFQQQDLFCIKGNEILLYIKTMFEKKKDEELQEYIQQLFQRNLIIDINGQQQLKNENFYTFPIFQNISANKFQEFNGNSKDLLSILQKLIKKFREFQQKIIQKRLINNNLIMQNFKEFLQLIQKTNELQKVILTDYSDLKKLACYINIYQIMRFHKYLQNYYIKQFTDKIKKKQHLSLLEKIKTILFGQQNQVNEFIYEIDGIQTSLNQIKHGILRNNKPANNFKPLNKLDSRLIQYENKGIFTLFVEEYEENGYELIQELQYLDESRIQSYIQKQINAFIQQFVAIDLNESEMIIHPIMEIYLSDFGTIKQLFKWIIDNLDEEYNKNQILDLYNKGQFQIIFKDPNVM